MTLVTTSRRPKAGLRALARDLAFTLDATYLPRGKHGLREIAEEDPFFLVITSEGNSIEMCAYFEGEPIIKRAVKKISPAVRNDKFQKGLRTTDAGFYTTLSRYFPVSLLEIDKKDNRENVLIFDGPQRRRINLTLNDA